MNINTNNKIQYVSKNTYMIRKVGFKSDNIKIHKVKRTIIYMSSDNT
jgi:hypothetical protein